MCKMAIERFKFTFFLHTTVDEDENTLNFSNPYVSLRQVAAFPSVVVLYFFLNIFSRKLGYLELCNLQKYNIHCPAAK